MFLKTLLSKNVDNAQYLYHEAGNTKLLPDEEL